MSAFTKSLRVSCRRSTAALLTTSRSENGLANTLRPGASSFHTSPIAQKTVKEKVTEVADKVNMSVGKGLASAIDKGEQVTHATKETLGVASEKTRDQAENAQHAARETMDQAGQKAKNAKDKLENEMNMRK